MLDIGSGDVGASAYWLGQTVALDLQPGAPTTRRLPVAGSIFDLPVRDRSARVVICMDVLEHMSSGRRPVAVQELVRVAGERLIIGVPTGGAASQHDAAMAAVYEESRGHADAFFQEHLDHGLPSERDLRSMIGTALEHEGRTASVTYRWNANLLLRSAMMRMYARRRLVDRIGWAVLLAAGPLISRFHVRPAYRIIADVALSVDG